MIILSFGMQRSGSTLFYELTRLILEENGYEQSLLPAQLTGHDGADNFIDDLSIDRLESLREFTRDQRVCLKTHSPVSGEVARYLQAHREDFPVIVVNFRDPRAIGLSLLDAGHHARLRVAFQPSRFKLALTRLSHRNPYREAFANLIDHGDALDLVSTSIENAATWIKIPQTACFGYEALMEDFDGQVQALAAALNLSTSAEALQEKIAGRFTQKHVGEPERFRRMMSEEMQRQYLERVAGRFKAVFGQDLV